MRPFLLAAVLVGPPALEVPPENLAAGTMPALQPAEEMASRLVAAIERGDAGEVLDEFFPAEAFNVLKGIRRPWEYHAQLVKWFVADVEREHEAVKAKGSLTYDGFRKGSCVWKAVHSEGNDVAYWSCYSSRFFARTETGERVEFRLKAMINWGPSWYVTHLGPIP